MSVEDVMSWANFGDRGESFTDPRTMGPRPIGGPHAITAPCRCLNLCHVIT